MVRTCDATDSSYSKSVVVGVIFAALVISISSLDLPLLKFLDSDLLILVIFTGDFCVNACCKFILFFGE